LAEINKTCIIYRKTQKHGLVKEGRFTTVKGMKDAAWEFGRGKRGDGAD
jgi:hypothetical protein